ncbi:MAG: hypothetical protein AAGA17_20475 [Actinomycetota bacterium]
MSTAYDEERRGAPALLIILAALSVAGFVAAVAVMSFAEDDEPVAAPVVDRVASVQAQPNETELAQAASGVIETFEVFGAKNPFERPLAFEIPPTEVPDPDDGSGEPTGDPSEGDGGETAPPTTDFAPERGTRVQLREIYDIESGTVATIVVDGIAYEEVAEGQTFATTFQVVSLDVGTGCGMFLNGDVDFELCVGQEILK